MAPKKSLQVGIIGAAGLSAGKLIEILSRHPCATIATCVSESSSGAPVMKSHPHLRGRVALLFEPFDIRKLGRCDVVFSCKKAGQTFDFIQDLLKTGCRFIDLSGDYRLKSQEVFETWYGIPHRHPQLPLKAVYGLPEWYRARIRKARLVANPGCYTTTAILGCAPIVAAGYGRTAPIVIDAISGVSGAGRVAKTENLFISVAENVRAYRIGNHQHTPEIEQELTAIANLGAARRKQSASAPVQVLFVPHVGPYRIGIMANCYLRAEGGPRNPTDQSLHELLLRAYKDEPFVRVYPPGELPQIEHAAGTNYCDIGVKYDKRTDMIVVISTTDNVVKGAAGQAVQNMNIMFCFDERTALG